jgi:hypothetical protein
MEARLKIPVTRKPRLGWRDLMWLCLACALVSGLVWGVLT